VPFIQILDVCAELLAVAIENGKSVYYAGIFARAGGPINKIGDLKGHSIAFGDINSASSFVFPMAMILGAKLDPILDLGAVRLTGQRTFHRGGMSCVGIEARQWCLLGILEREHRLEPLAKVVVTAEGVRHANIPGRH